MNKTMLVIGAGPGIGLETARRFGREGFSLVLAGRNPEKLQPQVDALKAQGIAVTMESVDASDGAAVTALVERHGANLGVLFYNAAAMRFGPTIDQVPAEALDQDIQINLSSALRAIKAALPDMTARRAGTILLTGGGLADAPNPIALTMSLGKLGLRGTAQALFGPLKEQNIHIAVLTISASVTPESDVVRDIAEAYWQTHAAPIADWTPERRYPTPQ